MTDSGFIVAVIGAGPAGIYASKQLTAHGHEVVLINKDIKPGGLAEYGIYPAKHKIREGLRKQFRAILSDPKVHYFGNVEVGEYGDVSLLQLKEMGFSAILVAAGAQAGKFLSIPGEELRGVYQAKDVVYHYNLLPPFSRMPMKIGKKVAIVGAGNVMMDLARWLIDEKQVDEVVAVVRRGPAEVKFDKKELETVIASMDMNILQQEIDRVSPVMRSIGQDPDAAMAYYQEAYENAEPHSSPTRFLLRFLCSPRKMVANDHGIVKELVVEENSLQQANGGTKAIGTGTYKTLNVDTVILAIGDAVDEKLGLPVTGTQFVGNPNPTYPVEGISYEVIDFAAEKSTKGIFLAGWSRQASTGLVGTARKDATNAAAAIQAYLTAEGVKPAQGAPDLLSTLEQLLPHRVNYAAIQRLEEYEQTQAALQGLVEFKLDSNLKMLKVIRGGE